MSGLGMGTPSVLLRRSYRAMVTGFSWELSFSSSEGVSPLQVIQVLQDRLFCQLQSIYQPLLLGELGLMG